MARPNMKRSAVMILDSLRNVMDVYFFVYKQNDSTSDGNTDMTYFY